MLNVIGPARAARAARGDPGGWLASLRPCLTVERPRDLTDVLVWVEGVHLGI
jgi:hypothetical protein